jgi:hypothetical protein
MEKRRPKDNGFDRIHEHLQDVLKGTYEPREYEDKTFYAIFNYLEPETDGEGAGEGVHTAKADY